MKKGCTVNIIATDPHLYESYALAKWLSTDGERCCAEVSDEHVLPISVRARIYRGCSVAFDDMVGHSSSELVLAHEYLAGIFLLEQERLLFAMRPYDGLDARIDRARDL